MPSRARLPSFDETLVVVSAGTSDCFARRGGTSRISCVSIARPERPRQHKPFAPCSCASPTSAKGFSSQAGCRGREEWHVPHVSRPETKRDRKSTRLNSSHSQISYAVFCLKKITTPLRHLDVVVDRLLIRNIAETARVHDNHIRRASIDLERYPSLLAQSPLHILSVYQILD